MPEPTAEELAAAAQAKADADAAAKAKADADAAAAKAAGEVKFSQADLDKIAGNSRQEGRTAAERELLEKLGVTDVDAAKAAIAAAKAAEDANKTELQRVTEERDAAKAEAERAQRIATSSIAVNRLEGSLRDAGLKPERIAAALKLVDVASLQVNGTDVSGITEAVDGLKVLSPEWFGSARTAPDATGGGSTGTDFRTASNDELAKELEKFGIRA